MNITKLTEDNLPGLRNILVLDATRVVSAGERPSGIYVNEGVCYYSDSPATYLEGTPQTTELNEEPVVIEGKPMYKITLSTIIPKNRPAIINQLMKWIGNKRFVTLSRDYNGFIWMVGTRLTPARFFINYKSIRKNFDEGNEMEVGFTLTTKDPAYNYTINYQGVENAGTIYIGKRIFA